MTRNLSDNFPPCEHSSEYAILKVMEPKQTSPWLEATPDDRRWPVLSGTVHTDVTVLGGGIVGVLAAYQLAKAGKSVVLLEKNRIASGETGYSTAFITRVPDVPSLSKLVKHYGEQFVQKLFTKNRKAQEYLFSLIENEHIDCDFARCPSYYFSYDGNNASLKSDMEVLKKVEPETELVTLEAHAAFSAAHEAIRFNDEARFDVRKFLLGLLEQNVMEGLKIFEDSEATKIEIGNTVRVTTEKGTVESAYVIDATGMPHAAFPELQNLAKSMITYAIVAKYDEKPNIEDALYWDTEHPYHYLRHVGENEIMIGGEDHDAGKGIAKQAFVKLEQYAKEKIPDTFTVTNTWSGTLHETPDELPYATEHPWHKGKVAFVTGLAGNGMVMGTLSAQVAAELAQGKNHAAEHLFALERTHTKLAHQKNGTAGQKETSPSWIWKVLFPLLFLALLPIPAYVFFHARGGIAFLSGTDLKTASLLLFPLVGLYAFFFVWAQIILGSSMDLFRKLYPRIVTFHRGQGTFALLFALTHPTLLFIGVGPFAYFHHTFVDPSKVLFIWFGYFQVTLITLTAGTALLMQFPIIKKYWRWIHFANYAVFASVWTHSWFLGSDVRTTGLRYLWLFYAATVVAALVWRVARGWRPHSGIPGSGKSLAGSVSSQQTRPGYVTVGPVDSFTEGRPFCAEINGKKIVLVKIGNSFSAIDNVCNHAGGSLCDGTLEDGTTIVCPLHASQFDMRTGNVLRGPARKPQPRYEVIVDNGQVLVKTTPETTTP